jgi:hypothetical protein
MDTWLLIPSAACAAAGPAPMSDGPMVAALVAAMNVRLDQVCGGSAMDPMKQIATALWEVLTATPR